MPRTLKWSLAVVLILGIGVILGEMFLAYIPFSHASRNHTPMNTGILTLKLGEYGKDLIAHNSIKIKKSGVGGLSFFEVSDIATHTEPIVRFVQNQRTLEIPRARSVMMLEDPTKDWPIDEATIDVKMPPPPADVSDIDAMKGYDAAVFALYKDTVNSVRQAGWKRYIDLSHPRIAGIETYSFIPGYRHVAVDWDTQIYPDPNYGLTFEDWLHLRESATWVWYLDGATISLHFSRSPREAGYDVHDEFRVDIYNDHNILNGYDPQQSSNFEAGVEAYKKSVPEQLEKRKMKEAQASAAGIPIMKDYVDPAIGGIPVPQQ